MNYKIASVVSLLMGTSLMWLVIKAEMPDLPAAITGQAGVVFFLLGFWFFFRSISFANIINMIESGQAEGTVKEARTAERLLSSIAINRITKIMLFFVLALLITSLYGCGGRFMYVEFGLDRMAPEDKVRLSKILTNNPDGRRESWYNKRSNTQYTITPVHTYWSSGGQDAHGKPERRLCREYLIDDVFPYQAHPNNRGHKQLTEYACYDTHIDRWYAVSQFERPFIQVGGPNYHNWRRR